MNWQSDHFQNYRNLDLECKHDKDEQLFGAETLSGPWRNRPLVLLDLVFIVTQFLVKKEGPRLYYRRRKIGDAKEKSGERESTVPFSLVALHFRHLPWRQVLSKSIIIMASLERLSPQFAFLKRRICNKNKKTIWDEFWSQFTTWYA